MNGRLDLERIRAALRTRRIGRTIELLDSTTSTNDCVCAGAGPPEDGRVVFAEYQTAGRGRLGHSWASPRGASLMFSVLMCDGSEAPADAILVLAVAIACRDGIAASTDAAPLIQWPNDLYVGGRKLGGVLVENRVLPGHGRIRVVGIGINCLQQPGHFPPALRERATSLEIESAGPVEREAVAAAILNQLDAWLAAPRSWSAESLCRAWLDRAAPLGRRVHLRHAGREYTGQIVELDPTAAIVVQLEQGGRRVFEAASTTILGASADSERSHPHAGA